MTLVAQEIDSIPFEDPDRVATVAALVSRFTALKSMSFEDDTISTFSPPVDVRGVGKLAAEEERLGGEFCGPCALESEQCLGICTAPDGCTRGSCDNRTNCIGVCASAVCIVKLNVFAPQVRGRRQARTRSLSANTRLS